MHCPTTLVVNGKETQFPLPEPSMPLNFTNSTGLRYEAEEVRQCLLKGKYFWVEGSALVPQVVSNAVFEGSDFCTVFLWKMLSLYLTKSF